MMDSVISGLLRQVLCMQMGFGTRSNLCKMSSVLLICHLLSDAFRFLKTMLLHAEDL